MLLCCCACGSGDANGKDQTLTGADVVTDAFASDSEVKDVADKDAVVSPDSSSSDLIVGDTGKLPAGAVCTTDQQCQPGLKCCYPCGKAGCDNKCTTPMAGNECPLYP